MVDDLRRHRLALSKRSNRDGRGAGVRLYARRLFVPFLVTSSNISYFLWLTILYLLLEFFCVNRDCSFRSYHRSIALVLNAKTSASLWCLPVASRLLFSCCAAVGSTVVASRGFPWLPVCGFPVALFSTPLRWLLVPSRGSRL